MTSYYDSVVKNYFLIFDISIISNHLQEFIKFISKCTIICKMAVHMKHKFLDKFVNSIFAFHVNLLFQLKLVIY